MAQAAPQPTSRAAGRPPTASTAQENGYDQPVTDPKEIAGVVADFQSSFEAMKVPATIDSCRLVEQVAVGVAGGVISHGAICRVSIAHAPKRDMMLCNDDGLGHFAIQAGVWVESRGMGRELCPPELLRRVRRCG
jgi:hypothetical protein